MPLTFFLPVEKFPLFLPDQTIVRVRGLTHGFNGPTPGILEIYTAGPEHQRQMRSWKGAGTIIRIQYPGEKMKHTQIILVGSLCMICLVLGVMPVAAAPVNGTSWNTNPEHITAMQAYVAYAGAKGQAQMDGAISYIGTISNGAGTSQLSPSNRSSPAPSHRCSR